MAFAQAVYEIPGDLAFGINTKGICSKSCAWSVKGRERPTKVNKSMAFADTVDEIPNDLAEDINAEGYCADCGGSVDRRE